MLVGDCCCCGEGGGGGDARGREGERAMSWRASASVFDIKVEKDARLELVRSTQVYLDRRERDQRADT